MTHPNTDSRELDELIDAIPAYSVMAEGIKDELRAAILAYTANKQKELLEWVEQEVVGKINAVCPDVEIVKELQRQFIKNKKESLS